MADYIYSLDLGKIGDYHGEVLAEVKSIIRSRTSNARRGLTDDGKEEIIYPEIHVRYLGRHQLSYDKVVDKVLLRMEDPRIIHNCDLLVDATGVGIPVLDFMKRMQLDPIGVWISSGKDPNSKDYGYSVPKGDLISTLQIALSIGCLKFSKGLDQEIVKQLQHEFQFFSEKKKSPTHTTYEAWREKDHDDILLALAILVWRVFQMHGIKIQRKPRKLKTSNDYDPLRHGL